MKLIPVSRAATTAWWTQPKQLARFRHRLCINRRRRLNPRPVLLRDGAIFIPGKLEHGWEFRSFPASKSSDLRHYWVSTSGGRRGIREQECSPSAPIGQLPGPEDPNAAEYHSPFDSPQQGGLSRPMSNSGFADRSSLSAASALSLCLVRTI